MWENEDCLFALLCPCPHEYGIYSCISQNNSTATLFWQEYCVISSLPRNACGDSCYSF